MLQAIEKLINIINVIKTPIRANKRGYRVIYSIFCFAQYFVEQKKFYSSFFSFVFWRMQKRKTNQKEKTDAFNINRGCTPITPPYISFATPQGKWGGV